MPSAASLPAPIKWPCCSGFSVCSPAFVFLFGGIVDIAVLRTGNVERRIYEAAESSVLVETTLVALHQRSYSRDASASVWRQFRPALIAGPHHKSGAPVSEARHLARNLAAVLDRGQPMPF